MTREQYEKLQSKIGNKLCPICGATIVNFLYDKTDIFRPIHMGIEDFKYVDIPSKEYDNIECKRCGYVMKFNIEKLLR